MAYCVKWKFPSKSRNWEPFTMTTFQGKPLYCFIGTWFNLGMDPSLRSFRKVKPCESHILNHLEYSTTGDKILVCAGNAQPKVRLIKPTCGTVLCVCVCWKYSILRDVISIILWAVYYCKTFSEALRGSVNINCSSWVTLEAIASRTNTFMMKINSTKLFYLTGPGPWRGQCHGVSQGWSVCLGPDAE